MGGLLKDIPDHWGSKFEGPTGAVTRTQTGPNEIAFIAPSHMALIMFSTQPGREIALNSDRRAIGTAPVGSVELVPAGAELFARWRVAKENLLVAMDDARLTRLAGLEFETDTFELQPPRLGHVDDRGLMLAHLIRDEVLRGEMANEDCIDSLLTVFGIYLLRQYSSVRARPPGVVKGGLAAGAWREVNDYIQAHLSEKISVSDMARIAGLSPSHFLRAFRRTTGQPPHQFLLAARLGRARDLIVASDMPFGLIARLSGFNSNSHMTATMRRVWQTTPSELRRRG